MLHSSFSSRRQAIRRMQAKCSGWAAGAEALTVGSSLLLLISAARPSPSCKPVCSMGLIFSSLPLCLDPGQCCNLPSHPSFFFWHTWEALPITGSLMKKFMGMNTGTQAALFLLFTKSSKTVSGTQIIFFYFLLNPLSLFAVQLITIFADTWELYNYQHNSSKQEIACHH